VAQLTTEGCGGCLYIVLYATPPRLWVCSQFKKNVEWAWRSSTTTIKGQENKSSLTNDS
jgi:hypothetical protein